MLPDPLWLAEAKKYIGLKEIPGPKHNAVIVHWAGELSAGQIQDDETAWCATFTGAMLKEAGMALPSNPLSARAYLELPMILTKPCVGALAIFYRGERNGWQGHIGIVAGKDQHGNLMIISGNHNNAVTCSPYTTERLLGYRWPSIKPKPERYDLPIVASDGTVGGSEA